MAQGGPETDLARANMIPVEEAAMAGAYDSQSAPNAPAVPMTPIPPSGGAPLPYQPFG